MEIVRGGGCLAGLIQGNAFPSQSRQGFLKNLHANWLTTLLLYRRGLNRQQAASPPKQDPAPKQEPTTRLRSTRYRIHSPGCLLGNFVNSYHHKHQEEQDQPLMASENRQRIMSPVSFLTLNEPFVPGIKKKKFYVTNLSLFQQELHPLQKSFELEQVSTHTHTKKI